MNHARKLSVYYIVVTPIVASISTLELRIGGLNYTGLIWAALLVVGFCLLAVTPISRTLGQGPTTWLPWLVWFGFVFASLSWCDQITSRNLQDALQLSMPLIVGMLAARAIRNRAELKWLLAAFGVALVFLAMYTAAYQMRLLDFEVTRRHVRGAAITTMLVGCVFLSLFPSHKFFSFFGWGCCLALTTLTSSRMATLALLVAPVLHPYCRGRLLKQMMAGAMFAGIGLFLFNTETFHKHFFGGHSGTIGDLLSGSYDDEGRAVVWTEVWDEAWRRPLLGAGVGTTFDFVPRVWPDMNHVHNDYLRIFYELGLVGLSLFLAVCVWQLVNLYRWVDSTHGMVQFTFAAAWLGFWAMLISCLTDNTLVYNVVYTDPLFALLGAAHGVAAAELKENHSRARSVANEPNLRDLENRLVPQ